MFWMYTVYDGEIVSVDPQNHREYQPVARNGKKAKLCHKTAKWKEKWKLPEENWKNSDDA